MKILCIAEKPSQAKEIANKLADGEVNSQSSGVDYIYNYTFKFAYENQMCDFTMTSMVGHLMELEFEENYRNWHSCHPKELFHLPVYKRIAKDKEKVAENIKKLARHSRLLIIWTDCDREGENIGMEGVNIARSVNPGIIVKRAKFSVMLARELKYACQTPVSIDQALVDAVDTRSEIDLRIGAALTRFQTMLLQKKFPDLANQVISYGSCQFPTLGFVVERYLKIKNFVPEDFYKIDVKCKKGDIEVDFLWKRNYLFDELMCAILFDKCFKNPLCKIINITSSPTSKWRPLPLTTVELQKMGSKYLKLSSDKVMEIANNLYNKGFISYPRTETDQFDKKMDLKSLIEKQKHDTTYFNYCTKLLNNNKFLWPRQGKTNDMSHPPIHPTAASPGLQGDEKRVYDFITRRFLAACSEDAKGQQTTIEATIAEEEFYVKGLMVHEYNYLEIYIYEKWNDKLIPSFELNEEFIPSYLQMNEGKTTPPKLISEPELITIMSKNGIGTDATIHEHIKKILGRKYVYKTGNENLFHPHELGIGLVEAYDKIGLEKSLSRPFLRRELENSLKAICDGNQIKEDVLRNTIAMYLEVFNITNNNASVLLEVNNILYFC
ncbi:prokaryotic type I DNA topoisomerase [Neoconidiobolus thromboides FSU 785]|nr:prokaryotic type I DNA topoisomerase [Neoconidiobolus thromboides FSU 785]